MYTTTAPRVRAEGAAYGPHEVDTDCFPAARVLEDLPGASDVAVPRILARYAILRYWLLRQDAPDSALTRHAGRTARAYLHGLGDGCEATALARLLDDGPAFDRVLDAACAAEQAGHVEGAYALLRTGYTAARRGSDLSGATRCAAAIARLLEAAGADGVALWARRAKRMRQLTELR